MTFQCLISDKHSVLARPKRQGAVPCRFVWRPVVLFGALSFCLAPCRFSSAPCCFFGAPSFSESPLVSWGFYQRYFELEVAESFQLRRKVARFSCIRCYSRRTSPPSWIYVTACIMFRARQKPCPMVWDKYMFLSGKQISSLTLPTGKCSQKFHGLFDHWLNFGQAQHCFRQVELKCRLPKGQAKILIFADVYAGI